MLVHKCDLCKKVVERNKTIEVVAGLVQWRAYEFCEKCGRPVMAFLRKVKVLPESTK